VKVVGLDTSSRSSALLLRLLFRDLWRVEPRFMPLDPGAAERRLEGGAAAGGQAAPPEGEPEALLLIGDRALCRPRVPGWEVVDLGTEWTRWTGLPFVYALWIWRGAEAPAGLVARLQEAKRVGIARIDDIVASLGVDGAAGLGAAGCRDYLRRVIQYDLDAPQIEGMLAFFSLLERNGLTAAAPRPLLFLEP
jgi:chorismate dehydratase